LNKILSCPNCRNELSLDKWQKKLKDNKIILYQKYIEEMVSIFKVILSKINSLHNLFKLNKNKNYIKNDFRKRI
jgi:uncharacterized protein YbaR (Trm112 family)